LKSVLKTEIGFGSAETGKLGRAALGRATLARATLGRAGLPAFATPSEAVGGFAHLVRDRRNREAARELPASAVLIDAKKGLDEEVEGIIGKLDEVRQPKLLILNKVDIVDKEKLLGLAQALTAKAKFDTTFMVSALSGDGVADVRKWLAEHVPVGPWHYPEDEVSDAPLRQLAAEITREKLYLKLHQELPYQSTVETETWTERKDGSVRVEQIIYVERESQRKIVLGKSGQSIKAIGAAARRELSEIIEKPVHLFLFVKVREGWGDDPERYRQMGLEFPKE